MLKNGVLLGLFSAISWGGSSILMGVGLSLALGNSYFENTITSMFIIDIFACIALLLNLSINKNLIALKKIFLNKTFPLVLISAILGGPLGMSAYLLGIHYLGVSNTASICAIYPLVCAVFNSIINKESLNLRILIACGLSGVSIVLITYNDHQTHANLLLGIIACIVCILCWTSEAILSSKIMLKNTPPNALICTRVIISCICYAIIILVSKFELINIINSFKYLSIAGVMAGLSYLCWYKSISLIGATKATILNITYIFWTILFEFIFKLNNITINYILAGTLILISVFLISKPNN